MDVERRTGRIVGTLLLVQMAGSAVLNFRLEAPLFGEPGFLLSAAPHAQQIGASALVGLLLGAVFIAVAITVFPIVRAPSQVLALWLFALATVSLTVAVVEHASVMSMVSLSQDHRHVVLAIRGEPLIARTDASVRRAAPRAARSRQGIAGECGGPCAYAR